MKEKELNIKAYEFVKELISTEKVENSIPQRKGSTEHLQVIDLTKYLIESPIIRTSFMPEYSDYRITISIKGIKYKFKDNIYIKFYQFIDNLSKLDFFSEKVSIEYLKKETLFWLIEIKINGKSNQNLISSLQDKLDTEIKTVRYYYPILNLNIESPFEIGYSKFTYFTKEYFDNLLIKLQKDKDVSKEHFDSIYRKHQGRVFVSIEVNAEAQKAKEIAFKKACLSIDIIKLLSPTIQYPNDKCFLELENRMPFRSEFISIENNIENDFQLSISANQGPFPITNEFISKIKESFIRIFAVILSDSQKNEIELTAINVIQFISKSISETDLHLRISHLIMSIESIFLLDDEEYKMEKKCKRRMCDFLYPNGGKEKQILSEILTEMYKIRHKMTHKSVKLYIELKKLGEFQKSIISVILKLVDLKNQIISKENLIIELDKKVKANA